LEIVSSFPTTAFDAAPAGDFATPAALTFPASRWAEVQIAKPTKTTQVRARKAGNGLMRGMSRGFRGGDPEEKEAGFRKFDPVGFREEKSQMIRASNS
jgi:hypothetical protein